jgi:steroid delta-isomerase-like uncharacterized protein
MTAEANRALILRLFQETARGDLAVIDELVRPAAIFHSWAFPDARLAPAVGPEGQRDRLAMFRAAFPDSAFTLGHLGARADFVVLHWTASGTHRGALLGVPPTGKRITRRGTAIYCLVDGRIAEEWGYFDLRGLLRQLGADVASWQGEVAAHAGAEG